MHERTIIAKAEHEIAFNDLCNLMRKHQDKCDAKELLAIAANMVGKLIAMQDHRIMTQQIAMEIVAKNIELGNSQAMVMLHDTKGTA